MKTIIYLCLLPFMLIAGEIEALDFSYLKAKMPKLNTKLLDIHLKLYEGYVNQVNYIDSKMDKEEDPFLLQALRKQYGFEYDGMKLHELYFSQLGGKGSLVSKQKITYKIKKVFGDLDCFKAEVKSFAKTRGIGWVILFGKTDSSEIKLSWVAEHEKGFLSGWVPICVIDLWEHAYISQFGLDKSQYIDLIFQYIDWSVINARYVEGCKTAKDEYIRVSQP